MKKLLAFVLGVLVGFIGLETIGFRMAGTLPSSPSPAAVPAAVDQAVPASGDASELRATEIPSAPSAGSSGVRTASQKPGAFLFTASTGLYGASAPPEVRLLRETSDRSKLRADAAYLARLRSVFRAALESDLQALRYWTRFDRAKFNQVVEIAADLMLERNLQPPLRGSAILARQIEWSHESAGRLAAVLSPEELETIAEWGPLFGGFGVFRSAVEAFAIRGLPLPTREQLEELTAPRSFRGADGALYPSRTFNPAATPQSMNPQQRAYLSNVDRWTRASLLIRELNFIRVRDPEVWEIWPN